MFDDSGCKIVDKHIDVSSKDILGTATQVNGMYRLDRKEHTACAVAPTANQNIWHRRLAISHIDHSTLYKSCVMVYSLKVVMLCHVNLVSKVSSTGKCFQIKMQDEQQMCWKSFIQIFVDQCR